MLEASDSETGLHALFPLQPAPGYICRFIQADHCFFNQIPDNTDTIRIPGAIHLERPAQFSIMQ